MTKFLEGFKRFSRTILLLGVVLWMLALVIGQVVTSWIQNPPDLSQPHNVILTEDIPVISDNGCTIIEGTEICGEAAQEDHP